LPAMQIAAYDTDLAYIHDQGFGGYARGVAPGLLALLRQAGAENRRVVDLGCGSGIWARELVDAGFEATGVDISAAMIEIARQRVPEAEFHVGSFLKFPLPPCLAVTALSEVFNYLFDAQNSLGAIERVCRDAFDALPRGGHLIFDAAAPGRSRGRTQAFSEGEDWTCLVEYRHEPDRLVRRIVSFRKMGETYRRREETHSQQLLDEASVTQMLKHIGFRVQAVRAFGDFPLPEGVVGYVATKP
jgi:SAM-dependent methyltransferase